MSSNSHSLRRDAAHFEAPGGPAASREPRLNVVGVEAGEPVRLRNGQVLTLRDIRRDDADALRRGFSHLSAEEVRMRFLHPINELTPQMARQLCDIDPERAVALVLADPRGRTDTEIHAVARAYIDPVTLAAEFALIVQHAIAGQGIGTLMMRRLIERCRERGATEMWGDVLAENGAMLALCDHLGFQRHAQFGDPGVLRVTLPL